MDGDEQIRKSTTTNQQNTSKTPRDHSAAENGKKLQNENELN